jgi:hypothetical protein
MITLVSTPEYIEHVSPEVVSRWVATESPVNFRLLRHDFDIVTATNNAGFLRMTVAAGTFTGNVGDTISVYNKSLDASYTGIVQAGSTTTTIDTDITFITGFAPSDTALDPTRTITYFNDNTFYAGFYFEGRLTINGVLNTLTIIASPDSKGYADLDISGLLKIATSLGKTGDYSTLIMKEPSKSGNFFLEYRSSSWSGEIDTWEIAEGVGSPVSYPLWYYAECVRSIEQGSNLHEYEADDYNDAPFLNSFDRPTYFVGMPFDLSFIMPERALLSPAGEINVTIKTYDSNNILLSTTTSAVAGDSLEGYVCSLTIDPAAIEDNASYFTAEITAL